MISTGHTLVAVAGATFRQGLRGRLGLLAAAALLAVLGLGSVFQQFADRASLEMRLVTETGLALSAVLVLGTALLLACRGLGNDEDRHAVHALLALPLPRHGILLGHLTGIWLTLALYTAAMTASLAGVIWWRFGVLRPGLVVHMATLFTEGCVLATVASLLALGGSAVVAFFGAAAVAFLAHTEPTVAYLVRQTTIPSLETVVSTVYRLLPGLASIDVKACAVRDLPIPWTRLGWGAGSLSLWVAAVAVISCLVFARREP